MFYVLNEVEKTARANAKEALVSQVEITTQALRTWAEKTINIGKLLSKDELITKSFLNLDNSGSNDHKLVSDWFTKIKGLEIFDDFYLINTNGEILDTSNTKITPGTIHFVFKKLETMKRVKKEKYILTAPIQTPKEYSTRSDFETYSQIGIFSINQIVVENDLKGFLILLIDPRKDYNEILLQGRMGTSGETYAVDSNYTLKSFSRFEDQLQSLGQLTGDKSSILNIKVFNKKQFPTLMAQEVIKYKGLGYNIEGYQDYRGIPVLGAWDWVDELQLGITTEVDEAEALQNYRDIRNYILAIFLSFSGFLALALSILGGRNINQLAMLSLRSETLEDLVDRKSKELDDEKKISAQRKHLVAVGKMAGGIAHEVNNPLAIISGANSLIENYVERGIDSSDKILKRSEDIQNAVERISSIMESMLLISGSESTVVSTKVTICKLFNSMEKLFSDQFKEKNIDFTVDVDKDLEIKGQVEKISLAISNLVRNSVEAIEDDKGNKWIKLYAYTDKDNLIIKVTDSGNGIDHSIAKDMMDPFFTTNDDGTKKGLGLSLASHLLEQSGGHIEHLEDTENTTFQISFPKVS